MRHRQGFALVELLVAALLIAMAAAGALATWSISSRAPANKRVTEMGVYLATREIERLKAQKYVGLANGLQVLYGTDTFRYYDRLGAPTATNAAAAQGYKVQSWVAPMVNRDGINNTEDLIELKATVTDNSGAKTYDTEQTLLTFGGL